MVGNLSGDLFVNTTELATESGVPQMSLEEFVRRVAGPQAPAS
jgi:hypothetical protein